MKTADFDARTGVDTSENLSKFPSASFETPRSVMHTAQTEEGKVHTIQLKHPARLADAAVQTAFSVGDRASRERELTQNNRNMVYPFFF